MGTFETSYGERLLKVNIDGNIRVAKSEFVSENLDSQYCWACGRTDVRLDISHIVSVNRCQNDGMADVAWDKKNFQFECRNKCHLETETRRWGGHKNYKYKTEYLKKYELRIKRRNESNI